MATASSTGLHITVQSRIRYDGPTRDYVAKRTTQGMTGREIKRCLPATSPAYAKEAPSLL